MDRETMKKLTEIGIKASRGALKEGMRTEKPYANMAEDMRQVIKTTKSNEERAVANKMLRELETNPVLRETMNREEKVVNQDFAKKVERRTEQMIKKAIANGELKAPGKDYDDFMRRVHKK